MAMDSAKIMEICRNSQANYFYFYRERKSRHKVSMNIFLTNIQLKSPPSQGGLILDKTTIALRVLKQVFL